MIALAPVLAPMCGATLEEEGRLLPFTCTLRGPHKIHEAHGLCCDGERCASPLRAWPVCACLLPTRPGSHGSAACGLSDGTVSR